LTLAPTGVLTLRAVHRRSSQARSDPSALDGSEKVSITVRHPR
jgi:hypothetical protein